MNTLLIIPPAIISIDRKNDFHTRGGLNNGVQLIFIRARNGIWERKFILFGRFLVSVQKNYDIITVFRCKYRYVKCPERLAPTWIVYDIEQVKNRLSTCPQAFLNYCFCQSVFDDYAHFS